MEKKHTIMVSLPYGMCIRDMMRSDVLETLLPEARVVAVTPVADREDFIKEFSRDGIVLEKLKDYRLSRIEWFFWRMEYEIFWGLNVGSVRTMQIKDLTKKKTQLLAYLTQRVARMILGKNRWLMHKIEDLGPRLFGENGYGELFDKYSPSILVTSGTVGSNMEKPLMRAAKNRKIPIIIKVMSWDNFTTKGKIPVMPDKLIVWNDIMKQEAMQLYKYPEDDIFVAGSPQYDYYFNKDRFCSKDEFFKRIGADAGKKLISYAASGTALFADEREVMEKLCDSVENGEIAFPAQLLIRLHQTTDEGFYEKLRGRKSVVLLDGPGHFSGGLVDKWNPSEADMKHYAETMMHSDVVLNTGSTVSIDAAVFDTPIVNVNYDLSEKPYHDSIRKRYDYTHYAHVVSTGGVRIANNHPELIEHINAYLTDPSLDREGRKRIVSEQCYRFDGLAGKRIGTFILDFLKSSSKRT
jgi:hypothetical protein